MCFFLPSTHIPPCLGDRITTTTIDGCQLLLHSSASLHTWPKGLVVYTGRSRSLRSWPQGSLYRSPSVPSSTLLSSTHDHPFPFLISWISQLPPCKVSVSSRAFGFLSDLRQPVLHTSKQQALHAHVSVGLQR